MFFKNTVRLSEPSTRKILAKIYPFFEKHGLSKSFVIDDIIVVMEKTKIKVETTINDPVEKVWQYFTDPKHVVFWNNASDDWHTTSAESDLKVGGKFNYRMEAKNGNTGFDFIGTYKEVLPLKSLIYILDDGRRVEVFLKKIEEENQTHVSMVFEAETENPLEMQRQGWQAILDNFKKYTQSH